MGKDVFLLWVRLQNLYQYIWQWRGLVSNQIVQSTITCELKWSGG